MRRRFCLGTLGFSAILLSSAVVATGSSRVATKGMVELAPGAAVKARPSGAQVPLRREFARPGTFFGLVHPTGATRSSHATEGFFSGTLDSSGSFTGRLLIGGIVQPLSAVFLSDGSAAFPGDGYFLAFEGRKLSLRLEGEVIRATITRKGGSSAGTASRAIYGRNDPAPDSLLGSAAVRVHRIRFPSVAELLGGDRIVSDSAESTGTLIVTRTGLVYLAGVLDDGTLITCTSALTKGHSAPLYFEIPSRSTGPVGSFSGILDFDTLEAEEDAGVPQGNVLWFHQAGRR